MALSGGAARSQRRSGISTSPVSNPAITTVIGAFGFTLRFYHGNRGPRQVIDFFREHRKHRERLSSTVLIQNTNKIYDRH
jgi:hypothetical protein